MLEWKRLHIDLKSSLVLCTHGQVPHMKSIECCYHKAEGYWQILSQRAASYSFASLAEEIEFFKVAKPLFTTEIEYHALLYQSEMFQPDPDDVKALFQFWFREHDKLAVFHAYNKDFCAYYNGNCTHHDAEWFTRTGYEQACSGTTKIYDTDARTCSTHDPLVAAYLAHQRYHQHAQTQLNILFSSKLNPPDVTTNRENYYRQPRNGI